MIPISKQMQVMDTLSTGLSQDVLDLRDGILDPNKAKAISSLASKAIKSIAEGVMLANHQQIQREKIQASLKRTIVIDKNVEFKLKKLNQLKIIG